MICTLLHGNIQKEKDRDRKKYVFMVWKSYKAKDCLGRTLFPKRSISRTTRSINCLKATQPVPGNNTLAANLMARAWNSSTELQNVTTIGAAKSVARKWAKNLVY